MTGAVVRVLDCDTDLADGLDPDRLSQAKIEVRAVTEELAVGQWRERSWSEEIRDGAGLLVLDGLLLRRVNLDGRSGAELLAAGDVLRPWQEEDAIASVSRSSGWRVLERAQLAVLDLDFSRRIAPYPEIFGQLMARMLRRARYLAVIMAIIHQPRVEARLQMLLWHLADRCGVVRSDGVLVPMRLTHAILAELLAARRPTVSAALGSLQHRGLIVSTEQGWVLHGGPPGELQAMSAAK
jgi:CRP/FNR family transcriptional regulator, cyclic AMP receptor protein